MFLAPIRWIFLDDGRYGDPVGRPWWSAGHDQWGLDYWRIHLPVPRKPSKRRF